MAQDDMHVVVFRILAYVYDCMKRGVDVDKREISADVLGINRAYWVEIVSELVHRRYIKGVTVTHSTSGDGVYLENPRITMDGVEFLMNNSMMGKAAAFVKDYGGHLASLAVPFL